LAVNSQREGVNLGRLSTNGQREGVKLRRLSEDLLLEGGDPGGGEFPLGFGDSLTGVDQGPEVVSLLAEVVRLGARPILMRMLRKGSRRLPDGTGLEEPPA